MDTNASNENDKPALLKAIEIILADPAHIKREALKLKERHQKKWSYPALVDNVELSTPSSCVMSFS